MIMLFWEVLQCNKRFRSFIVDTDRVHDFVVLVLFYALHHKNDPAQQGIVRMCVFVLQTLSVEPTLGHRLNKPFRGQETLPTSIRIQNFRGSYSDFLVIVRGHSPRSVYSADPRAVDPLSDDSELWST